MCSIFASMDADEFRELYKLNSYRGTHSYSVSQFNGKGIDVIRQDFGEMPDVAVLEDQLIIGHSQAPTTEEKSLDNVHPSEYYGCYLWHNGIIKHHQIAEWQKDYGFDWKWDTQWLNFILTSSDFDVLSEVDGSFACLWYDQAFLYLFRNENCPMFMKGSTISSTKFDGSESIDANIIYKFTGDKWEEIPITFLTKEDFFWSP